MKNPRDFFIIRCGHSLTSKLNDQDILNIIRISYREAFFPEHKISDRDRDLVRKLYPEDK